MKRQFVGILFAILSGTIFPACDIFSSGKGEDYDFYKAVCFGTPAEVEAFLIRGHSPDYMGGQIKWVETNPLWNLGARSDGKIQILIRYGANVTTRPYLAHMLSWHVLSTHLADKIQQVEIQKYGNPLIAAPEENAYKSAKLFLDAGASPNLKGRGDEPPRGLTTDAECLGWYEVHGSLPINFAIERNLFSIVDLLLEYGATLDENSLEFAAKATANSGGNTEMQVKIQAIWDVTH